MTQTGYLLGIGSNIEPQDNIGQIIALLLNEFPSLTLSRVLELPPIGMNSQRDFLNVVVFIATTRSQDELKTICNEIEIQLGRDRSDPDRKIKDRPADLDILTAIQLPADQLKPAYSITDEYFIYPLLDEIIAFLCNKPVDLPQVGVELTIDGGLRFGQTATTINRNTSASNKRVI